jgi:hypothetical protein
MAKYRTIQTGIWSDPYIEELQAHEKLLYIYFFSNQHVNNAGVFKVSAKKIGFETGLNEKEYEQAMNKFIADGKVFIYEEYVLLVNFIKHQSSTSPKIIQSIKNDTEHLPNEIKHQLNIRYPYLQIPYQKNEKYGDKVKEGDAQQDTVNINIKNGAGEEAEDVLIPYRNPFNTLLGFQNTVEKSYDEREKGKGNKKELELEQEEGQYHEILSIYNTICESLPKVQFINLQPEDKRNLLNLYETLEFSLEKIHDYFSTVEKSDFLSGKNGKWMECDLFWLINPDNVTKVINGNYTNFSKKIVSSRIGTDNAMTAMAEWGRGG